MTFISAPVVTSLVVGLYAAVVTRCVLKLIDATVGLRVSENDEREGLDITLHGEEGYAGASGGAMGGGGGHEALAERDEAPEAPQPAAQRAAG